MLYTANHIYNIVTISSFNTGMKGMKIKKTKTDKKKKKIYNQVFGL